MSGQEAGWSLSNGLDYVFSFFAACHERQRGRFDREVRQPEIVAGLAARHGILPDPASTVLITGSKGKGSCARFVARHLERAGKKTGLILTPEELHHLDRIRIDGVPIPEVDFLDCLARLRPALDAPAPGQGPAYYHPPTAIFLLVGLMYFHEQGVDAVVIEGGRGACYDEIGQIPAAVGIVTSILLEHAGKIGPTLGEICLDKLSLARNCATLVCAPQVRDTALGLGLALPDGALVAEPATLADGLPAWVAVADTLARTAVAALGVPTEPLDNAQPPSCQVIDATLSPLLHGNETVFLDGAVSADCIDTAYLHSPRCAPRAIVLGLTADKDLAGVLALLRGAGFEHMYFFRPRSASGHVAAPRIDGAWTGEFDTATGMDDASRAAFLALVAQHQRLYVIGVQVFLRSVRTTLHLTRLGH